jgi:S1-C subfamily serine protease
MRSAALFLFGLVLGACARPVPSPTAPNPAVSHVEAAADLEAKTVALVGRGRDGSMRSYCTGTWVSDSSILTASHCVEDVNVGEGVAYVVRDDVYAPGVFNERPVIVARPSVLYDLDQEHDLALLRAASPVPHRVAGVALDSARPGAFAQTMGHAVGLWWSYSSGDVAAVRERELGDLTIVWVQATTPISPGSSGCGLFDANGRLMGVAHGSYSRGQSLNFFVHAQYVDTFLRKQGGRL